MKLYSYKGSVYQFSSGSVPEGAVELVVERKPVPRNKSGKPAGAK